MRRLWRWLGSADSMRLASSGLVMCSAIIVAGHDINGAIYAMTFACYFRLLAIEEGATP